eukprot:1107068-Rhodomonas_salina.2
MPHSVTIADDTGLNGVGRRAGEDCGEELALSSAERLEERPLMLWGRRIGSQHKSFTECLCTSMAQHA